MKKLCAYFLLILFICSLCFSGCANTNTHASSSSGENQVENPESDIESVCFEGKVTEFAFYDTDLLCGVPAAHAIIDIKSVDREPGFYAGAVISTDGTFSFDGLPVGKYMLTIKRGNMLYSSPIEITESISPFDASIRFKNESGNNIMYYYSGVSTFADLDGDGEDEDIYYAVDEDYKAILKINNINFSHLLEHIYSPSNHFAIIDIDKHDNLLHLAINDYGPSDDYHSFIFEYDGGGEKLLHIGDIEGVFERDFTGFGDIICDGDGSIISYTRLGIFQTWHAYKRWQFKDGKLIDTTGDIYYVIDSYGTRLKTIAPVTLYTAADEQSKQVTIPAGTQLHLTKTDDKKWVYCELNNGATEYVMLLDEESYGYRIINNGKPVEPMELFEGLCYAD